MGRLPRSRVPGTPVTLTGRVSGACASPVAEARTPGMVLVTLATSARVKAAAPGTGDRVPGHSASVARSRVNLGASAGLGERRGCLSQDAETERREGSDEHDSDSRQLPLLGAVASRRRHASRRSPPGRPVKRLTPGELSICPGHSPDSPLCRGGRGRARAAGAGVRRMGRSSQIGTGLPCLDLAVVSDRVAADFRGPLQGGYPQSSVRVPLSERAG